ncbi:hypothetical protein [Acuticoccus sp. I52.16.1]|uniref:hypothetical protein n=1 Tax=Acuticoccus sp. I52.16.1 TaxID=2928472 RepID=UPI001FD54ADD|nr:hypothetical protein [Acuticoccus sp. I52.16.1]UOM34744.1 hypothetical protein MRB58_00575 [Acuticoccus sp. I52.16.1]
MSDFGPFQTGLDDDGKIIFLPQRRMLDLSAVNGLPCPFCHRPVGKPDDDCDGGGSAPDGSTLQ